MDDQARIPSLMIIDDDEVDQMMYDRIIRRVGIVDHVHKFYLATEALAFLRRPDRPPISMIVLDINMPLMNGFEFLEAAIGEFGDDFAELVVVMLTTSLNPDDIARARAFTVVKEFANKPLTVEMVKSWPAKLLSLNGHQSG